MACSLIDQSTASRTANLPHLMTLCSMIRNISAANTQHMPLTDTARAKLGLVPASLLCFVLFLWLAVTPLYCPSC